MLERLFGKKQDKVPERQTTIAKIENFNIQEGHAYILLGGKDEKILTNCVACGAPYKGPCQPSCEFCATTRSTYYIDISNTKGLSSIPESAKNKDYSFILPEGSSAEFGDYASVDAIIAENVEAGDEFSPYLVIAKIFRCLDSCDIETLIIADNGSAKIGNDASIQTLITGKNVGPIIFEDNCYVGEMLFTTHGIKYKAGDELRIDTQKTITYEEFLRRLAEVNPQT